MYVRVPSKDKNRQMLIKLNLKTITLTLLFTEEISNKYNNHFMQLHFNLMSNTCQIAAAVRNTISMYYLIHHT